MTNGIKQNRNGVSARQINFALEILGKTCSITNNFKMNFSACSDSDLSLYFAEVMRVKPNTKKMLCIFGAFRVENKIMQTVQCVKKGPNIDE